MDAGDRACRRGRRECDAGEHAEMCTLETNVQPAYALPAPSRRRLYIIDRAPAQALPLPGNALRGCRQASLCLRDGAADHVILPAP